MVDASVPNLLKKEKEKRMQIEELLFRLQMYLFIYLIYCVSANLKCSTLKF